MISLINIQTRNTRQYPPSQAGIHTVSYPGLEKTLSLDHPPNLLPFLQQRLIQPTPKLHLLHPQQQHLIPFTPTNCAHDGYMESSLMTGLPLSAQPIWETTKCVANTPLLVGSARRSHPIPPASGSFVKSLQSSPAMATGTAFASNFQPHSPVSLVGQLHSPSVSGSSAGISPPLLISSQGQYTSDAISTCTSYFSMNPTITIATTGINTRVQSTVTAFPRTNPIASRNHPSALRALGPLDGQGATTSGSGETEAIIDESGFEKKWRVVVSSATLPTKRFQPTHAPSIVAATALPVVGSENSPTTSNCLVIEAKRPEAPTFHDGQPTSPSRRTPGPRLTSDLVDEDMGDELLFLCPDRRLPGCRISNEHRHQASFSIHLPR
ncbi:unnamed protein product [Protopolystoma xenopodis]|uniref:Uncharacterized protein n=1 Tax=Protopolystoma xenopodis TaxID=117903 RepID=A0A3S5BPC0_9PLAT|nr:unnamed protein product [Protopolystoma xenopodis]